MKDEKYSSCTGRDTKSVILKVRWKGWKIRNTQVQVEEIRNQKFAWLGGRDGRLEILKVRWQGCKIGNTER